MKQVYKPNLGVIILMTVTIFILFLSNIGYGSKIGMPKDSTILESVEREFRGFLEDIRDQYRIDITHNDTAISAQCQIIGHARLIYFRGKMLDKNNFILFEINTSGDKGSRYIKGKLNDSTLTGYFISGNSPKEINFKEINLEHAPPFKIDDNDRSISLQEYLSYFEEVMLPLPLDFTPGRRQIVDLIGFMDKPVRRIGSYDPPIILMERAKVLRNLSAFGRVSFGDKLQGMFVQSFCFDPVDGPLFSNYLYLYNDNEEFVDAIVVFEAVNPKEPRIYCKFSQSKIFNLYDLKEEHEFVIGEDGTIRFREH